MTELRIVFDGPPGPESGRFIEVENAQGASVNAGEWADIAARGRADHRRGAHAGGSAMTNRRGFLTGFSTLLAAPAIVRAESLMKLWAPPNADFRMSAFMTDVDAWPMDLNEASLGAMMQRTALDRVFMLPSKLLMSDVAARMFQDAASR